MLKKSGMVRKTTKTMRKFYLLSATLFLLGTILPTSAQPFSPPKIKEPEPYRRSSLTMIFVEDPRTDPAMSDLFRDVFLDIPVPAKYNDHEIDLSLRSFSLDDVQVTDYQESKIAIDESKKDGVKKFKNATRFIDGTASSVNIRIGPSNPAYDFNRFTIDTFERWIPHVAYHYLKQTNMGKRLVDKWFMVENGKLSVDLIRERAVYSATEVEQMTAAEASGRSPEDAIMDYGGHEIVGNTFVTISNVYLMTADQLAAEIIEQAAIGAAVLPQSVADLTMATAELSAEAAKQIVGNGNVVKCRTHLFRLVWNQEIFDKINACANDISKYNALDCFDLEYIGKTSQWEAIVAHRSTDVEAVYRCVSNVMDEVLADLEKEYEVFRTSTPLTQVSPIMTANIGTKECVEVGDKYEIVERRYEINKKSGRPEVKYGVIGMIEVDKVGNNMDDNTADDYTIFKPIRGQKKAYVGALIRRHF